MTIATALNPQVEPSTCLTGSCAIVIFGSAGDLTKRSKLQMDLEVIK